MKNRKNVYLRADGNTSTGHGHIVRALAFAEKIREEFDTHFLVRQTGSEIMASIHATCHNTSVLPDFASFTEEAEYICNSYLTKGDILVLDGYSFDREYQQRVVNAGVLLISIDDIQSFPYVSDVVINHAGGVSSSLFNIEPYTKLCLGPEFTLLRTGFEKVYGQSLPVKEINSVFVCYGGSDIRNLTCRSLRILLESDLGVSNIDVVTGSSFQYSDELQEILSVIKKDGVSVNLHHSLTTDEMIALMKRSQLAFISPSTVSYEATYIGMGIIAIQYVDNQEYIAGFLKESQCAIVIKDGDEFDEHFKKALSSINVDAVNSQISNQKKIFKPSGTNILNIVRKLAAEANLACRKSDGDDVDLLFNWANDPDVRINAINKDLIPFENHQRWYRSKMESNTSFIYIVEDIYDKSPVGQVRFDLMDSERFLIDYSIDLKKRGKGLGEVILRKGIKSLCSDYTGNISLEAKVKRSNAASAQVFKSLSFTFTSIEKIEGDEFLCFKK